MCVANSAISQLVEAIAKEIFGSNAWIESAGSEPKLVDQIAAAVQKELIDTSKQFSKSHDQLNPILTI